ncbi:hypothetical protein [Gordonia sp. (in: high G+C Gram-positive bacteria)]|uniref:hypothetical protein n=1 Tax=Gordonia sp. (in: high G+C Gram-positive bacteria) TaxID=84139 RepID=UPI003340E25E
MATTKNAEVEVEGEVVVDDAPKAREDMFAGQTKEPPNPKLIDQVPEDLSFSTDSGERRDAEKMLVSIDGVACYLYQPSDALMALLASSFAPGAELTEKISGMLNLVNASLDVNGTMLLRRAMFASDNSFDDELLGKLVAAILQKWAPSIAGNADLSTEKPKPSRPQRRAAAKKK